MAALKNKRWEAFACARANGETISSAYELAGYKANQSNAARLNRNEQVQARIEEIQAQKSKTALLTRADVLRELAENARIARSLDQIAASNQALNLIGKEFGMFVDRSLHGIRNLNDLSEEQLLEILGGEPSAEELRQAAGTPPVGHA